MVQTRLGCSCWRVCTHLVLPTMKMSDHSAECGCAGVCSPL